LRVVLDTNVLVSALLGSASSSARLLALWREGRFALLTSPTQLEELRRVTRYPRVRDRLPPALAGRLVNDLRSVAIVVEKFDMVAVSPDPNDDHLLALAVAGNADILVTGDKRDLLALRRHARTHIVTPRELLRVLGETPG
jgi:hypothetical protein